MFENIEWPLKYLIDNWSLEFLDGIVWKRTTRRSVSFRKHSGSSGKLSSRFDGVLKLKKSSGNQQATKSTLLVPGTVLVPYVVECSLFVEQICSTTILPEAVIIHTSSMFENMEWPEYSELIIEVLKRVCMKKICWEKRSASEWRMDSGSSGKGLQGVQKCGFFVNSRNGRECRRQGNALRFTWEVLWTAGLCSARDWPVMLIASSARIFK
jgi:hypothetical protein